MDTNVGMREGVPRLLELFREYSVRASFFISFGPDHSGRAVRRLWRPSFLLKMMRTNPVRLYGFRTLLSGTLLPSKPIGEGEPELLRSIVAQGHELGIHGYDHVRWQDRLEYMAEGEIEEELRKGAAAYERVLGVHPASSAAPGWRCTPSSLAVQDRLGFLYASDVRGLYPFFPVENGATFKTLQIPTTLPTMDELIGRVKDSRRALLSCLREGLNVLTVHAEVEGRAYHSLFESFLEEALARKPVIRPLLEVAKSIFQGDLKAIPHLPVRRGNVPGRSGWVACQGPLL
ncbi:MAG: 4-deoxy-4-formamido-L-arabinose-phosphoundecaprenol deformylase [Deltaproteobacteria bacterium]|nr:4-deoxy-4-formamido-L-arabinose-phosphoundecaprenol deformylase [Deltaproteobacteria bacterium]